MVHVAQCANCGKNLTQETMRFSKTDEVVCSNVCALAGNESQKPLDK